MSGFSRHRATIAVTAKEEHIGRKGGEELRHGLEPLRPSGRRPIQMPAGTQIRLASAISASTRTRVRQPRPSARLTHAPVQRADAVADDGPAGRDQRHAEDSASPQPFPHLALRPDGGRGARRPPRIRARAAGLRQRRQRQPAAPAAARRGGTGHRPRNWAGPAARRLLEAGSGPPRRRRGGRRAGRRAGSPPPSRRPPSRPRRNPAGRWRAPARSRCRAAPPW